MDQTRTVTHRPRSAGVAAGEAGATRAVAVGPGRFRADIQGLRAVAVTVVVLFHAGAGFSGGFVGVDVFFVISGYVITAMLRDEHRRSGHISLGRFYLRRIRRLLPALAVLLVAVLVLDPFLGPRNSGVTTSMATAGALFSANARLVVTSQGYFDARAEANPLLHLWTLSVEEQVYLVVPMLLVVAWRLGRSRWSWDRIATAVLTVTALVSFASAVLLAGRHLPGTGEHVVRFAFYSSPTRAWEFLVGALLAVTTPLLGRTLRSWSGAFGVGLLAVSVLRFDGSTAFPVIAALVPVVSAVLLLLAGTQDGSPVSRLLSAAPARWLGDRSYSWYLWHWPLIVFARSLFPGVGWAPLAAGLCSLAPACSSYALVEDPIRRRRAVRSAGTLALGAACIAVPLAVTRTTPPLTRRLDANREVHDLSAALRPHLDLTRRCNDSLPDPADAGDCTWRVEEPAGRAVLLGDSNAGQFSEPFVAAANAANLDATIQTRAACPFADVVVRRAGTVDRRCRSFYERQVEALVADPPDVVVLASALDLLIAKDEIELADRADGSFRSAEREQVLVWEAGLARTLARLDRAGIATVVVHPIPRFTGWQSPGECARLRVRIDVDGCGIERVAERSSPVAEAEARALRRHPRSIPVELRDDLCPLARCATNREGTWIWKDESHLSVDGARSVEPQFARAIRRAMAADRQRVGPGS